MSFTSLAWRTLPSESVADGAPGRRAARYDAGALVVVDGQDLSAIPGIGHLDLMSAPAELCETNSGKGEDEGKTIRMQPGNHTPWCSCIQLYNTVLYLLTL